MKKTIALFLVLILGVSLLAGCGGSTLTGKYNLQSITENGEEQSIEDLKAQFEEFDLGEFPEFYIDFKDDGHSSSSCTENPWKEHSQLTETLSS